jgi:hypothetical protein
MLKSCLDPGDLRIESRYLVVTKSFNSRHGLFMTTQQRKPQSFQKEMAGAQTVLAGN